MGHFFFTTILDNHPNVPHIRIVYTPNMDHRTTLLGQPKKSYYIFYTFTSGYK